MTSLVAAMIGAVGSAIRSALSAAPGSGFDGLLGSLAGRPSVRVYALAFVAAAALSMVATFVVRQKARRAGLFDLSDARKLHGTEIPRVGGVGIVLASWGFIHLMLATADAAAHRTEDPAAPDCSTGGCTGGRLAGAAASQPTG